MTSIPKNFFFADQKRYLCLLVDHSIPVLHLPHYHQRLIQGMKAVTAAMMNQLLAMSLSFKLVNKLKNS